MNINEEVKQLIENGDHPCQTGDCPHECQQECNIALADEKDVIKKLLEILEPIYTAGADGEQAMSCCEGKHFNVTLLAGDKLFHVNYFDALWLEALVKLIKE